MMKYPKEYLDEIKLRLKVSQIVGKSVQLKKRGKEFIGLSPFKNERTPSFTVSDEKGFYHCFSTGEHGNIFDFIMKTQSVGFGDAVKLLAVEAGMEIYRFSKGDEKREKRFSTYKNIYAKYNEISSRNLFEKSNSFALEYLIKRGLKKNVIEEFGLGYVPKDFDSYKILSQEFSEEEINLSGIYYKNDRSKKYVDRFSSRLTFPINNLSKEIIAYGGRIIENKRLAKYINSPETEFYKKGKLLFNLDKAKLERPKNSEIIIVEGYMDVISLYSRGIKNVISNSGTALTEKQIELIWKIFPDPIICLDGDESGQAAAMRIAERLFCLINDVNKIYFSILPNGQDPDDFIKKNSKEVFIDFLKKKQMIQDFIWNFEIKKINLSDPYDVSKFEKKIKKIFNGIKDQTIKKYIMENLSQKISELTPNLNRSRNFNKYKGKSYKMLSETKNIFEKKNKFSEENLKELSFLYLLITFPEIISHKIEEISEVSLSNVEHENLKIELLKCYTDTNFDKNRFAEITKKYVDLIDMIRSNSNVKIILKNKNINEVSEILSEISTEIKFLQKSKKLQNLEDKLINNLDEKSYSELVKLKTQINTD